MKFKRSMEAAKAMKAASTLIDEIVEMDKKQEPMMSVDDVSKVLEDMQDIEINVDRFEI